MSTEELQPATSPMNETEEEEGLRREDKSVVMGGGVKDGVGEDKVEDDKRREGVEGGEEVTSEGGEEDKMEDDKGREGINVEGVSGGGGREGMVGRQGGRTNDDLSDINLATPTSDLQGLEFFDHNVTSSDSSGNYHTTVYYKETSLSTTLCTNHSCIYYL